jgi:hypothetical protein
MEAGQTHVGPRGTCTCQPRPGSPPWPDALIFDLAQIDGGTVSREQRTLEAVARQVAPAGAEVHHLCAAGVGTFSIATLGGGTDGVVYALKVIGEPPPGTGRRASEFTALRRIVHPNAVRYRATGTQRHGNGEYRWLAMDFVNGSTLAQLLADGAVFDAPTAVRLLREAVSGAAALWDAGATHGNLAADNVMITPSGRVVIVDLGLAQGDDWRSDQFALGLLGYRMANGADPAVPPELFHILAKMLATRPEDRYAEPAALESDLEKVAETLGPAGDHVVVPQSPGGLCHGHAKRGFASFEEPS